MSSRAESHLEVFAAARRRLAEAATTREQIVEVWNGLDPNAVFGAWLDTGEDGRGELRAGSYIAEEAAEALDRRAAAFLKSVKESLDAAVLAAAQTVCTPMWPVDPDLHRMPLMTTAEEFDVLVPNGHFLGLRPDQVRVLRELQPFAAGSSAAVFVGTHMSHLAAALDALGRGERLVCGWATHTGPDLRLPDGATLVWFETESDGPLTSPRLLATFQVDPPETAGQVEVLPNVALDLALTVPPWPANIDDTFQARSRNLLVIVTHLIDGLERSVSTPTFFQQFGRLDDLAPTAAWSLWKPVVFESAEQEAEAREGLTGSDLNLASLRGDDGTYTLLRLDGDRVVGREIPEASPPEPSLPLGTGTELATLEAAAAWGLPDFAFHAKVVTKGSGRREIGDGTLVTGNRGIVLQVKARDGATTVATRESSWLRKKAGEGLRQAHGTIRSTLPDPNLSLTNFRDREVELPGDTIDWVPVVILDHPSPPDDVVPDQEPEKNGLILLRRDWEFLWDQLRSASAVVDYAHRVADKERIALGTEVGRYFDLADKDEHAEPDPMAGWMVEAGAAQTSGPTLPREPADTADAVGHSVFHHILEDIANTDLAGDERTRLHILALIDKFWVGHRAELGRTLLRRIDHCALSPADELRAQHRIIYIDGGQLQLTFSVYSQFTGYHQQLFQTWVLHRRQRFLQQAGATGPDFPWTVAVLLTPRPDGARLWDTTVLATNSGPAYDEEAFESIGRAFAQPGATDETIL